VKAGDVYIKRLKNGKDIFRRIIAIHLGVVVYSRGGDTNGMCTVQNFSKWASNTRVERVEADLLNSVRG
jgi:hypothetical protein